MVYSRFGQMQSIMTVCIHSQEALRTTTAEIPVSWTGCHSRPLSYYTDHKMYPYLGTASTGKPSSTGNLLRWATATSGRK